MKNIFYVAAAIFASNVYAEATFGDAGNHPSFISSDFYKKHEFKVWDNDIKPEGLKYTYAYLSRTNNITKLLYFETMYRKGFDKKIIPPTHAIELSFSNLVNKHLSEKEFVFIKELLGLLKISSQEAETVIRANIEKRTFIDILNFPAYPVDDYKIFANSPKGVPILRIERILSEKERIALKKKWEHLGKTKHR